MKKRGWWTETDKIEDANLVWTQIKVASILDKEEKMADKIVDEPDSWHFKKGPELENN